MPQEDFNVVLVYLGGDDTADDLYERKIADAGIRGGIILCLNSPVGSIPIFSNSCETNKLHLDRFHACHFAS